MAREGYPFVIIPALMALGCLSLGWWGAGILSVVAAGFMGFFFRDPDRAIPPDEQVVVSPADGKVIEISKSNPSDPASPTRLSIFLSVFDVHVNRAPIAGHIKDFEYRPGKFRAAFNDAASEFNEQSVITIDGQNTSLVFKQIAGLLARRIVFTKRPGDSVARGERVGLIQFGSRVDVILPPEIELTVKKDERVYGGSSIIGKIPS